MATTDRDDWSDAGYEILEEVAAARGWDFVEGNEVLILNQAELVLGEL